MGTRGTICLVYNGVKKTWYVHWDSDMLGSMLVRDMQLLLAAFGGDMQCIKTMVANLKIVETDAPTQEQIKLLRQFADITVDRRTVEDWYCLLHGCQQSLINTLVAGYIEDAGDTRGEFNWVLDFDSNEFYYDDCPHFPLDNIPLDWNERCSAFLAREREAAESTTQ